MTSLYDDGVAASQGQLCSGCCRSRTAHELPVSAIELTLAPEAGSASGVGFFTHSWRQCQGVPDLRRERLLLRAATD